MKDNPTKNAHEWLIKKFEENYGASEKWDDDVREEFVEQLGLLADFVTDCWPKEKG